MNYGTSGIDGGGDDDPAKVPSPMNRMGALSSPGNDDEYVMHIEATDGESGDPLLLSTSNWGPTPPQTAAPPAQCCPPESSNGGMVLFSGERMDIDGNINNRTSAKVEIHPVSPGCYNSPAEKKKISLSRYILWQVPTCFRLFFQK